MAGSKCNKCSRPLLDCQGCKGGRATSNVFGALTSALPGTLPSGVDNRGALIYHCLDVGQPVAAQLAIDEELLIRALGGTHDDA